MPKKAAQDWENLEQELHSAGVDPAEVEAGARRLLAEARRHQLAEDVRSMGENAALAGRRHGRRSALRHDEEG
jgi:hypothetical protein